MTEAASGILVTACALTVASSLVFASLARPWPDRRAAAIAIAGAALATILLFVGTIWLSTDRLGDVRLRLRQVTFAFDDRDKGRAVSFGGDRDRDHIVIAGRTANEPRMAAGAFTIRRSPADAGALELRFNGGRADRWTGLVFQGDVHSDLLGRLWQHVWPSARSPIGAVDFDKATSLCLPRAGGVDSVRLAEDGKRLTFNGRNAFYALRPPKGDPALIQDYAAVARPASQPDIPRSRSLLLRHGSLWQLVILDPGAYAVRGDCGSGAPMPVAPPLLMHAGDAKQLSFRPLSTSEPWQIAAAIAAKADKPPRSRLVERRSGTVRVSTNDSGALLLSFALDSPESLRIAASDINDGSTRDLTLSLGGEENRAWGLDLAATRFRATGAPLASGFVQRLELGSSTAALIGNRSVTPIRQGQPFELGTRDRASVVLERLDLGWLPIAGAPWLAVAGLIGSLAATWGWRRRSAYAFIVLAMADFLLTMRLLVAIEAAVIDPSGPGTAQAIPASLLALAMAPAFLAALAPAGEKMAVRRAWVIAHSVIVAAIAAYVFWFNGLKAELFAMSCLALLAASYIRLRPRSGTRAATIAHGLTSRAAAAVRTFAALLTKAVSPVRSRLGREHSGTETVPAPDSFAETLTIMLAASILLTVRLLLPEQLLSPRTAVIYTPLWLAYCAFAFRRAAAAIATGLAPGWMSWALWILLLPLPLIWALFSFVGSDPGFAVVNLAVVVVMVALLMLWFNAGATARFVPVLPATAAAIVLVLVLVLSSTSTISSSWPDPMDLSAATEQKRLDLIENSIRASRIERRIEAWFSPARLAESGTREAEELTVALQQMRQYSSQGLFGRGYLNQPEPTELRLYQLNDNVSAVHLLAPFGRMGTAAFLLVLGCGAAGATWRRIDRTQRGPPTFGESAAYVALWTLFVGGAYMVLANLQLVPFTGRNVFMLAASSTSDLMEGMTLIAVALVGLRPREPAT